MQQFLIGYLIVGPDVLRPIEELLEAMKPVVALVAKFRDDLLEAAETLEGEHVKDRMDAEALRAFREGVAALPPAVDREELFSHMVNLAGTPEDIVVADEALVRKLYAWWHEKWSANSGPHLVVREFPGDSERVILFTGQTSSGDNPENEEYETLTALLNAGVWSLLEFA